MIRYFFKSLEDPKRRLLGPNIWNIARTGLILPENKHFKVAYIFMHELVTLFVITQYMEIYVVRSDLNQVIENIRVLFSSIICVIKASAFLLKQNRWKQVLEYVTEADEYERVHQEKIRGEIIDRYTKYCRRATYFFWVLLFVTCLTLISTLLVALLSSQNFREGLHNGSEIFPHILSLWMAIDKNQSPGSWITVIWHIFICACDGLLVTAYDTSIIIIMSFFGGKLDLLRERAKIILGTPENEISDDEAENIMQYLQHEHVLLMKHSRLFNSLLSPVIFLYLNHCANAYQLTILKGAYSYYTLLRK